MAKAERVPAYVIFSNQTLEHLARLRPSTREAGLLVKGIGEAKATKYLEPFLKVIREED
jgi:ATP-dependent DNA helicase RecQ